MLVILGLGLILCDFLELGITVLFLDAVIQVLRINKTTPHFLAIKNCIVLFILYLLFIKSVILVLT